MANFKAVCIRGGEGIVPGEVVLAFKRFNMMFYKKSNKLSFKVGMDPVVFWKSFMIFNNYYVVEKPMIKRRFRKAKRQFLRVEFPNISEQRLAVLYKCVFSYIELIKQKNPDLIGVFNYSIVSTLDKLSYLYKNVTPYEFDEAVTSSEYLFKEIYKTAIKLELEGNLNSANENELLREFKLDNQLLGEFFKELNK